MEMMDLGRGYEDEEPLVLKLIVPTSTGWPATVTFHCDFFGLTYRPLNLSPS